jgi:UDP-N-acetylglucosamine acyltransferase
MPTTQIHPNAIVEPGAELGTGCVIHAFAFVGRHCRLAEGVVVHPFAVLGGDPQDLGFDASRETRVHIGARTVVREHVTVNRATRDGGATEVGEDCFLMTGSHLAHDCRIGDRVVMANAVLLGGHVQVGDRAFLGGGAVIHQFCRIGEGAMIGGGARVSSDVAPFCMAAERNTIVGLNVVGLRRRKLSPAVMRELKLAYRAVYAAPGNRRRLAAAQLERRGFSSTEANSFLNFFAAGTRTFARTRHSADDADMA